MFSTKSENWKVENLSLTHLWNTVIEHLKTHGPTLTTCEAQNQSDGFDVISEHMRGHEVAMIRVALRTHVVVDVLWMFCCAPQHQRNAG
jgi:hypothetical protein